MYFISIYMYRFFFFFSSRRRHTRWTGDWSSDVCSSDLICSSSRNGIRRPRSGSAPAPSSRGCRVRSSGSKPRLERPMTELERKLVELGRVLQVATPPPVTARVAADLRRHRPPDSRRGVRSSAAIAFLAAVVAVAAAVAVPSARTSLLRFFHLGGVTIERVDKLPQVVPRGPLAPGKEVGFAKARASVPFTVLVPGKDPTPSHAFSYTSDPPGGQVTLVYGQLRKPRLLVTEFLGQKADGPLKKTASPRTVVEHVEISGHP